MGELAHLTLTSFVLGALVLMSGVVLPLSWYILRNHKFALLSGNSPRPQHSVRRGSPKSQSQSSLM